MKFIFCLVFSFGLTHLFGQNVCTINVGLKDKIDSMYASLIKSNEMMGVSIAIVDHGEIVYATGYGFEDVKNQKPASANSIYRIGSITKSFTALSIMQLQEKGVVHLDSSIEKYVTDFQIGSHFIHKAIPLRAILSHTSGLPGDLLNGFFTEEPPSSEWTLLQLKQIHLSYPPGYCHAYSNLGYELLGELIERTSGQTYETYLNEHIFKPLNMTSSFVYVKEDRKPPLSYNGKQEVIEPPIRDASAGLIHSSARDMGNFLIMLLNKGEFRGNQVVSESSISQMRKNQLNQITLTDNSNYGFGLYTKNFTYQNETDSIPISIVGHGGDTYTFHADMKFIPELGVGVVVLTNTVGGERMNSGERLLKLYLDTTNYVKFIPLNPSETNKPFAKPNKGFYAINNMVFELKDARKFQLKQGSVKIKAKQHDLGYYTIKGLIFGLIPIPIKNQALYFEEIEHQLYIRSLDLHSKKSNFIGLQIHPKGISQEWINALGNYRITNAYPCRECSKLDIHFEDAILNVSEEKGFLRFTLKNAGQMINFENFANEIEEHVALTHGIGRNNGDTFRILENGTLYYSGFVFEKIN